MVSGKEGFINMINFHYDLTEDWNVQKMKYLLDKPVTDGPHETPEFIEEGIPFLSVDSIQDGKLIFDNCRYISKEDHSRFKKKCNPKKDDIFMGKAASIGKIAIVDVNFEFSIWSPLALLRPNLDKVLPKFLEYSLKSDYSQDQIELYATSNTQKNISMDDIHRIQLIIPPLNKQKLLIKYLDKKTTQIDKTIKEDTQLIELLKEKRTALINHVVTKGLDPDAKMKDSGVEWIGEIPEGWEILKLKFIADERKIKEKNGEIQPYLGLENIESSTARIINYNTENIEGESLKFKENDVLFGKLRPYLAKVALADKNGVCTSELIIYIPKKKILPEFLMYKLISKDYIDYVNSITYGVRMPRADPNALLNTKQSVPKISEQEKIVSYLCKETSKIDGTIKKIEKKIELLEEYKKSLIHHVVTGKVNVLKED